MPDSVLSPAPVSATTVLPRTRAQSGSITASWEQLSAERAQVAEPPRGSAIHRRERGANATRPVRDRCEWLSVERRRHSRPSARARPGHRLECAEDRARAPGTRRRRRAGESARRWRSCRGGRSSPTGRCARARLVARETESRRARCAPRQRRGAARLRAAAARSGEPPTHAFSRPRYRRSVCFRRRRELPEDHGEPGRTARPRDERAARGSGGGPLRDVHGAVAVHLRDDDREIAPLHGRFELAAMAPPHAPTMELDRVTERPRATFDLRLVTLETADNCDSLDSTPPSVVDVGCATSARTSRTRGRTTMSWTRASEIRRATSDSRSWP